MYMHANTLKESSKEGNTNYRLTDAVNAADIEPLIALFETLGECTS